VSDLANGSYHWRLRAVDSYGRAGAWASYATNTESDADFVVDTPPSVPTSRGQLRANGTTGIPLGATVPPQTVVFRGTVSDPDAGQTVRLQVEVKRLGIAFTGTVSCQSGLVASGTTATCEVPGLAAGRYHWRLRTRDSLGAVSAWVSYATNAETEADFILNTAPAAPTARGQLKADGTMPIGLGGTVPPPTVVFRGTASDANAGQTVRVQVELKPVGTDFTGTVSCSSAWVSSGTAATCQVTGLAAERYHWRLRSMDNLGGTSAWVSYATNAETDADFVVNTAPGLPTVRRQLQADETTAIPLGGKATSDTVVFRGTVSDADAGQTVRLQVEVKPVGTAFTGTGSCESNLVGNGTATSCAVSGLAAGTGYHWRLRAVDSRGGASAWASYATNAEDAPDFRTAP
jgi:predicted phage tail protein